MRVPTGDTHCSACGKPLSGPYWVIHGDPRHTDCVDWAALSRPPYAFRLKEVRDRYTKLRAELRALERVGRLLAIAGKDWPRDALAHAQRILEAVQFLDQYWPSGKGVGHEQDREGGS